MIGRLILKMLQGLFLGEMFAVSKLRREVLRLLAVGLGDTWHRKVGGADIKQQVGGGRGPRGLCLGAGHHVTPRHCPLLALVT